MEQQKKHLYNARLGKFRWFVQRFGARELVMKPLRTVFAPFIIPTLPRKNFTFLGQELPYLFHRYNMTWASERCVEVPVARFFISKYSAGAVLEVGNVLSHYGPIEHEVLDKFEKGNRVINQDIIEYRPSKNYDLIISVSTFEHIGFDDEAEGSSAEKINRALSACRSILQERGTLVITVPIGYNPELDLMLRQDSLSASHVDYLKKYGHLDWRECGRDEALACKYKTPFPYANAIAILEFNKS